ncbi:MAG: acetyl-CoA carboxylase biotin carboxyl carrier protein [Gemmatimonadales bacterium]|jgi:acetyl-CoA carboxylase biotin carboxyl carrier protein
MIDLDWIQRLIDMMDDSDVDSLEISKFATRVRISKSPPVHVVAGANHAAPPATTAPAAPAASAAPPPKEVGAAEDSGGGGEAKAAASNTVDVESPMVGTFYRAPAPDAPPYVEVGDHVSKGQTLCILEAMKLMNELEAEVAGTVRQICISNGDPVEYGQALFRIEPD